MTFDFSFFRIPYLDNCNNINSMVRVWFHQHMISIRRWSLKEVSLYYILGLFCKRSKK